MNITSVSFGANNVNSREYGYNEPIPAWVNSRSKVNTSMERVPKQDEYRTSQPQKTHQTKPVSKNHKKKSIIPTAAKTFAAGVAATLLLNFGVALGEKTPALVKVPFDANTTSISEIAELYGCDEDIIRLYNGINSDEDAQDLTEIKIPSEYNYIQEEIDALQNKLYSSKLSADERKDIEKEIDALQAKQEEQNQVAKSYTDGKYVYYRISLGDGEDAVYGGINVEDFKTLFDIEDGAIRRNNKLDSKWKKDTNFEEDKGYFDYTGNILRDGDVIKVRPSSVETDDIDLSDFIEE